MGERKKRKKYPRNRSRTSDLEISVVAIYSLPLCQLSYTRIVSAQWEHRDLCQCLVSSVSTKKKVDALCGDRTHALTNTRLKRAP